MRQAREEVQQRKLQEEDALKQNYSSACIVSKMKVMYNAQILVTNFLYFVPSIFTQSIQCFFEKKIYFHKTDLQKYHTYNTKHTIYKKKEIKAKKETRNNKRRKKTKWG